MTTLLDVRDVTFGRCELCHGVLTLEAGRWVTIEKGRLIRHCFECTEVLGTVAVLRAISEENARCPHGVDTRRYDCGTICACCFHPCHAHVELGRLGCYEMVSAGHGNIDECSCDHFYR